ncbi:MAG: hypothetical protein Q8M24_08570 [Pseudolabrys sp.]|nr:hypothetical protein [Pseudolabrys sp.]MDP2295501.1 hypothetical protein [Pseudolabrys sp.]
MTPFLDHHLSYFTNENIVFDNKDNGHMNSPCRDKGMAALGLFGRRPEVRSDRYQGAEVTADKEERSVLFEIIFSVGDFANSRIMSVS